MEFAKLITRVNHNSLQDLRVETSNVLKAQRRRTQPLKFGLRERSAWELKPCADAALARQVAVVFYCKSSACFTTETFDPLSREGRGFSIPVEPARYNPCAKARIGVFLCKVSLTFPCQPLIPRRPAIAHIVIAPFASCTKLLIC